MKKIILTGFAIMSLLPLSAQIFDTGSNVGIGYSSPEFKLHIITGGNMDRSIGFSNADSYINDQSSLIYTAGGNGYGIFQSAGNLLIQPRTSAARGIFFNTYDGNELSTRFSINSNGNVGIGTTTPDAELAVKGQIHTQEVKVDLNGSVAPDFVFEDNYDLRTLEETELYITLHRHLPEIPSASEMEENGFELKKMNLKLLQKVEELTLYLIEQNKKIETLHNKVEQLENQE